MDHTSIIEFLMELGNRVSKKTRELLRDKTLEDRIGIHSRTGSDVIYNIDSDVEQIIVDTLEERSGAFGGIVLVAEGIGDDEISVYPKGMDRDRAKLRMICDPIDGTRLMMYEKRSAFFLAGVATNMGPETRLSHIEAAVMAEIPTSRSSYSDILWSIKGEGAHGRTLNTGDNSYEEFTPHPSKEKSIRGGYAQISRFFPPGRDMLAAIEEELLRELFPDADEGEILTFEDQYTSSGGQLYEMLTGKDRFVADLRASLYGKMRGDGHRIGHICHPYDLAAHMIGREAGIIITDITGKELDAPMETTLPMDWIGYANMDIHDEVAPVLNSIMKRHGLLYT